MTGASEELRRSARRLRALERAGFSSSVDTGAYDRLADVAKRVTNAAAAFVSIVRPDTDFYLGHSGLPEPLATARVTIGETISSLTLGRSTPLVIDDISADPTFASVPTVTALRIGAYLAAPIRSVEGEALGSFCLLDSTPRQWTSVEIELVVQLALSAEREIALRHPETGIAAAQQNQALMRVAGAVARVGGWAVDVSDNSMYWSDEIHEILERGSKPELDGALDMYPPGERKRVADALTACSTDVVAFDLDLVVRTHAGNMLEVRAVGEPEYDDAGRIVRVVGAFQDVSRQAAQSRAANELATRLTETLESISDAFYSLDCEWRSTYVNARAEALLERPRQELLGKVAWDVFAPAAQTAFFRSFHRAVETGQSEVVTDRYGRYDSWFEASAFPFASGLSVYFRDVTEQRRSQIQLEARGRLLDEQRRMLDAASDAILVCDSADRITYWNDGAARLYGWSPDEAMGRLSADLIGSDPAETARADAVLDSTGSFTGELRHGTRSGERRLVLARWTATRSENDEVSVMAINTDITDARQLEEQLLRAQRLESIGTLAGGIAHDINNVLAPILLAVDLLCHEIVNPAQTAILESVRSSAVRGSNLIQQVLLFARGAEGRRMAVPVGDVLDNTALIVRDTFSKSIELRVNVGHGVRDRTVIAEPTRLQQILLNLCVNARDALPEGGIITLGADLFEIDEQNAALTPAVAEGTYVVFQVEDNGTGMPAEVLDRCFEPFFTTKAHGQGTGLGLSTSLAIAESHGGFIRGYSEVGRGTTFRLYVPLAIGSAAASQSGQNVDIVGGRGELVLVVDDDSAGLDVTAKTLMAFGYNVITAANGAEAVTIFEQRRLEIDLVLTDMMMPVMDGPSAVQILKGIRPDVAIVAASGLDAEGRTARMMELGVNHFLAKPYSATNLLQVLRAALDQS